MIFVRDGPDTPALAAAVALAFIVFLDAKSLRGQVGKHAVAINALSKTDNSSKLRERIGHTPVELAAGMVVGACVGTLAGLFLP